MEPIRVLIVDDSPFVCRILAGHLNSAENIEVIGTAHSGERAVEMIADLRPDVVTLAQAMAGMSGINTLKRIMHDHPTPVVMITGVSQRSAVITRKALEIGAVDFVLKFAPGVSVSPEEMKHEIISKVSAASRVRVIRSIRPYETRSDEVVELEREALAEPAMAYSKGATPTAVAERQPLAAASTEVAAPPEKVAFSDNVENGVVVIGASTGGPVALREFLSKIPADFNRPILIVQHMPASFTEVLAEQLSRHSRLPVREATHGDKLVAGEVLVARGDHHLLINPNSRIILNQGPKIRGHRPSIDVTMQSVAQVYGANTFGVILTGMGDDGAEGMVSIHAKGGRTFAQDAESCVVNGMPQRARDRGVVQYIAPPPKLAEFLLQA